MPRPPTTSYVRAASSSETGTSWERRPSSSGSDAPSLGSGLRPYRADGSETTVGIDLGSRWKMLGVPVGFEIRIDFAVNDENPRRALRDPRPYRLEVGERAHRRA